MHNEKREKLNDILGVFAILLIFVAAIFTFNTSASEKKQKNDSVKAVSKMEVFNGNKIKKTDEEWKKELTFEEFRVTRQKGTELPFTGKYYKNEKDGMYHCSNCGLPLFSSNTKFESGTGWPSFTDPAVNKNIETRVDKSHGMIRTEVICNRCGAHLGHVFNDGPGTSGLRYCINSVSLDFEEADEAKKKK